MVDDINFQKILPSLSTDGKVNKAGRQKKQNQHPPFQKRLRSGKNGNKDKENSQKHDRNGKEASAYRQNMKDDSSTTNDSTELPKIKKGKVGKLIDIRA